MVKAIEQREKHGVNTHILAFHELTTTTAQLPVHSSTSKPIGTGLRRITSGNAETVSRPNPTPASPRATIRDFLTLLF